MSKARKDDLYLPKTDENCIRRRPLCRWAPISVAKRVIVRTGTETSQRMGVISTDGRRL